MTRGILVKSCCRSAM